MRKQTKSSLMPTHACQHCSNVQTVPSCEPPIEKGRSRNFFAVMESWRTWMWPLEWSSRIKFTVRTPSVNTLFGEKTTNIWLLSLLPTKQQGLSFAGCQDLHGILCFAFRLCHGEPQRRGLLATAAGGSQRAHRAWGDALAPGDGEWACHRSGLEEMAPKFMISADSIISKLEIFMGDGVAIKECDWRLVSC